MNILEKELWQVKNENLTTISKKNLYILYEKCHKNVITKSQDKILIKIRSKLYIYKDKIQIFLEIKVVNLREKIYLL